MRSSSDGSIAELSARLEHNRRLQAQVGTLLNDVDTLLRTVTVRLHVATYASLPEPRADTDIYMSNEPSTSVRTSTKPKALVSRFRRPIGMPYFVSYDRDVAPVRPELIVEAVPVKPAAPWTSEERDVGYERVADRAAAKQWR